MGVRIKVKLKFNKKELETVAFASAGFEAKECELILPPPVAERLGFWPQLPEGTRVEIYEVAGGQKVESYFIPKKIETEVITEDRISKVREAIPVIVRNEREVVFSDQLISAHGIALEDPAKGLWRFKNEKKIRRGEEPKYW